MANIHALLQRKEFWPFYVRANEEALGNDVLSMFDMGDDRCNNTEISIDIPCHPNYSLEVNIVADPFMINLGLKNTLTNTVSEMGWWDDARWHPFSLHWQELLGISEYWNKLDINHSAAFLLLAVFVGHGADEIPLLAQRENLIRGHYKQLGIYTDEEIIELAKNTIIRPAEDDYNWSDDVELGLIFTGEYPCYSLRNKQHLDGAEGSFPFSDWSLIMEKL